VILWAADWAAWRQATETWPVAAATPGKGWLSRTSLEKRPNPKFYRRMGLRLRGRTLSTRSSATAQKQRWPHNLAGSRRADELCQQGPCPRSLAAAVRGTLIFPTAETALVGQAARAHMQGSEPPTVRWRGHVLTRRSSSALRGTNPALCTQPGCGRYRTRRAFGAERYFEPGKPTHG